MIVDAYEHIWDRHGCCISDQRYHQRCLCPGPITYCQTECDKDNYCKGYVEATWDDPEGKCHIATSSHCPSQCSGNTHDYGNVGPLLVGASCGSSHGGCYIKRNESMQEILSMLLFTI